MNCTDEQKKAIEARGKVIVSASAGSGKTFVMIQKLVEAIESGVDLDSVLAVTFTKKAAAQMKEKLAKAIIAAIPAADGQTRANLKVQLSKIPSADISTIHSFCAKLLRTYFYALGIDGSFDILPTDDAEMREFRRRAVDGLFEGYYESGDPRLKILLKYFRKKRSDESLKSAVCEAYERLRINRDYLKILDAAENLYTEEGFFKVCAELEKEQKSKYISLKRAIDEFEITFDGGKNSPQYSAIFEEMRQNLIIASASGIFDPLPPLTSKRKPTACEDDGGADEKFVRFRDGVKKSYKAVRDGYAAQERELEYFIKSGEAARAFSSVVRDFDREYTLLKRDENKLDYNDLEQLTCDLLDDENIKKEINSKYTRVFVDEYQDVNPVQELIISGVGEGAETFFVGDVKQAIYGFRGSKSLFFANKYEKFLGGDGSALRLTHNFRSSGGVIDFVNGVFSEAMTEDTCGFSYAAAPMVAGAPYPEGSGGAQIRVFGSEQKPPKPEGVYSVLSAGRKKEYSREGLCALKIVKEELTKSRYDLESGKVVPVQAGDICILTRKNKSENVQAIVRALTDAGYVVEGSGGDNLSERPECKNMLDILSYIDNPCQDVPLVTALLSPLGGFCEDELARIRVATRDFKARCFYENCDIYCQKRRDELSDKLKNFFKKFSELKELSKILTAGELVDKICVDAGYEAKYSAGGGQKLKNIRRLSAEGGKSTLQAFLSRLSDGGYNIPAAPKSSENSIKVMTMHASKGLEFPIVILADICRTFKGSDNAELPLDEQFGFAPKYRDDGEMLQYPTVLRRLVKARQDREELKNELNLFYVACTRAMSRLYILAEEQCEYSAVDALSARSYDKLFDISRFECVYDDLSEEKVVSPAPDAAIAAEAGDMAEELGRLFMRPYDHADGVNLPVKFSASALLRLRDDEEYYCPGKLFSDEGETGVESGLAYHRFLELCDFSKKSPEDISAEIAKFTADGKLSEGAAKLLSCESLSEILSMPVFSDVAGAETYREQEFLCKLPAADFLGAGGEDEVLFQGAIDLLCVVRDGVKIIDYKYSKKDAASLKSKYAPQLALYKKVVAKIWKIPEENVATVIVNIFSREQIPLDSI